jgi:hypothetical protein
MWPAIALAAVLGVTACGGSSTSPSPPPASGMAEVARAYLEELLTLMQANSINRLTIDWSSFRATVFNQAANAQSIFQTQPAIRTAINLLGDGHSSYRDAAGVLVIQPGRLCAPSTATTPTVPATIGYVKVAGFGGIGAEATAFANGLQQAIRAADKRDLVGWIVDVRGNRGGNMWPMVAGVGPLLGEGVIGYFIDPNGAENVWEYRNGASWDNGVAQQRVDAPYRLRRAQPRVAVLTDAGTLSSGEATVIAFRGRPDTRSFGTPTCGLSTAVENYPLSDGGILNLTISVMADRLRTKYGTAVVPDEVIDDETQAVERAIAWVRTGR